MGLGISWWGNLYQPFLYYVDIESFLPLISKGCVSAVLLLYIPIYHEYQYLQSKGSKYDLEFAKCDNGCSIVKKVRYYRNNKKSNF